MGERLAIRRTRLTLRVLDGGMIERHPQWCFLSQPHGMTRKKTRHKRNMYIKTISLHRFYTKLRILGVGLMKKKLAWSPL